MWALCADDADKAVQRRVVSYSAALAFAYDTVARYGEPVGDAGHDHVRVPLTQQELARRNGCSPGTVNWYLRRLGPAVVARRNGIVFDRSALTKLQAGTPELAPRTALVERALLECFARPAADGTCVELLVGDSANPRPPSLQGLAAQLGINRSSAHRHVSALERAGRLQRRGRRLYAVPPRHLTKELFVDHQPQAPSSGAGLGAVSPQQVLHLLEKLTDLLTMVAGMANQLLGATAAATPGAHDPRFGGAQSAVSAELHAAAVADRVAGFPLRLT